MTGGGLIRRARSAVIAAAVLPATLVALGVGSGHAAATWWHPPAHITWYWQLQGKLPDPLPAVQVIDVDGFDTSAATVTSMHGQGIHAVCYIDVGTWENWRPDASSFGKSLLGAPNGWPGERWLNIARIKALAPIMRARFEMCKRKGFDAVEPDNMDGYTNHSGFALTAAEQLRYDEWVARTVHSLGMAVLQKNDNGQSRQLEPYFDGALDEQCNQYQECGTFEPYLQAGKPVLNAEYKGSLYPGFCANDKRLGISGALYNLALNGKVFEPCWAQ
jgi:hypothetical protein